MTTPDETQPPTSPSSQLERAVAHFGQSNDHATLELQEAILRYHPRRIAPTKWLPVRDFTLACILDAKPHDMLYTRILLTFASRYVVWAFHDAGAELRRDDLFYPSMIYRFARTYPSAKTQQLAETRLLNLAEALGYEPSPHRLNKQSREIRPFSHAELPAFESWAASRSTDRARRDSYGLLALAGGAGLGATEIAAVRGRDLTRTPAGWVVRVTGKAPRSIPIRVGWDSYADIAFEGLGDDDYAVIPHRKESSREIALMHYGARYDGPAIRRLRITWIVDQINVLPLASIVYAAGFKNVSSLLRYAPLAEVMPEVELHALLRSTGATQ